MNNAGCAEMDGCRCFVRINAFTSCFSRNDFHPFIVQIVIIGSHRVAAAAHTGNQIVGIIATALFLQLQLYFFADNRLEEANHVGVGVRSYRGANDIKRVGVGTPVTNGFVGGILQCHVATGYRFNRCTQHPHFLNIEVLPFYICFPHKHDTFHSHQRARGSCSHSMLSGTCFSQYFCFAHSFGEQDLTQRVVDFVSAGVIKVFPLQIDVCAVGFR